MNIGTLHPWSVTAREAIALQQRLAPMVVGAGNPQGVRLIAGADISVGSRFSRTRVGRGAVVVLSWPELMVVEQSVVETPVSFPYVPGLLSFREIPVLLPALARLRHIPDLLVVDGQGIAHPRRFGLACHLGLLLDLPTIGCAKSRLTGALDGALAAARGSQATLVARGETIGAAVRTRQGANPIYVSVGHRIGLEEAIAWTLALSPRYRVPVPTRLADQAAAGRVLIDSEYEGLVSQS